MAEAKVDTPKKLQRDVDKKIQEWGKRVNELMSTGALEAVGYRIVVKPITVTKNLAHAEKEIAPTLAAKGFESRTEEQREREERGENHGIVIHLGPDAYGDKPSAWCEVGDVILYTRYAGQRVEHPPGSKNFFQIINDEDVFGVLKT
jgi:co-chaperonin GroES (HSP10)